MVPRSRAALLPRGFSQLPWWSRLLVLGRALAFPHGALVSRAEGGAVAELGCGHGLLCAHLADARPGRHVTGVDPDARKIALARAAAGDRPELEFHASTPEVLSSERPGAFDTVVVADVLYLMPEAQALALLQVARTLLRPHGLLLLWEAVDDGSLHVTRAHLQERLMVRALGLTHGATVRPFSRRENLEGLLGRAGFRVDEAVQKADRLRTPHLLLMARAV